MSDMDEDLFKDTTFGKIALEKIKPTDPNFRLYMAGWMGNTNERKVMDVTGAVFRKAAAGPRKGELCIMVPGTRVTAYVTAEEMEAYDEKNEHENHCNLRFPATMNTDEDHCSCRISKNPEGLYTSLRNMHWSDGKLAVIEAKDLPLGVQTYSGDMLDEAIQRNSK